ncbi:MAG: rRNA pseudouridine synthase [Erysipelotrichaceae bacterium]|nr:rRNA pseudouridine synthase [Erysipelotrichaceae bacterium]
MERLQKVIAASGLTSRRKSEELITSGKVRVNGEVVTVLGTQVSANDAITVDGKPLPTQQLEYYLVNKPRKYVCTVNDEHGRKQVTDLVETSARIYPVGRLDYDSSGLIILTNDGEFANLLMHPRYHIPKLYHVTVRGIVSKSDVRALSGGVVLDDGIKTLPAQVRITNTDIPNEKTSLDITIMEGRNRQIRRMMEALGYEVSKLHRVQYGCVRDDQLLSGNYRRLKPHEIKTLKEMALQGEKD